MVVSANMVERNSCEQEVSLALVYQTVSGQGTTHPCKMGYFCSAEEMCLYRESGYSRMWQ